MEQARYYDANTPQQTPPPKGKKRKKRKNFWRFWRRYTLVSLAITALALAALWQLLAQYEACRPAAVPEGMTAQLTQRQLDCLIPALEQQQSPYADAAALETALRDKLEGAALDSRSEPGAENSYLLTADGEAFARVALAPDGGKGLLGFQKWKADGVELLWQLTQEYTVTAPRQASVTLNGQPLSPDDGQTGVLEGYAGLPEDMPAPELVTWTVKTAGQPQLEGSMEGSGPCRVDWQDSAATLSLPASEQLQQEIAPLAEEFSQYYARFITQDAGFGQLSGYLLQGTEFYTSLTQFYNGWYVTHDSYRFSNLELSDYQMYSPDHLSCRVKFDYSVFRGAKEYPFPSSYILYYQNTDSGWKLANLVIQ